MPHDLLRSDSPAAQLELGWLKTTKVGDKRSSELFPALPESIEWVCIGATKDRWEFVGTFLELPVFQVVIHATETALTLDLEAA